MADAEPAGKLEPQFSSPDATPTEWSEARGILEAAEIYWLSTVRPDGRPHVTPLVAVWLDGAMYFCTGPEERKARNLEGNSSCVITTGRNAFEGLDLVVEGHAERLTDDTKLDRVADRFNAKYDAPFHFVARDGAFYGEEGDGGGGLVFEVKPRTIFAFGKGDSFSQTRWRV
jgi:general stress protein 26